jgi:hypothetical protein
VQHDIQYKLTPQEKSLLEAFRLIANPKARNAVAAVVRAMANEQKEVVEKA